MCEVIGHRAKTAGEATNPGHQAGKSPLGDFGNTQLTLQKPIITPLLASFSAKRMSLTQTFIPVFMYLALQGKRCLLPRSHQTGTAACKQLAQKTAWAQGLEVTVQSHTETHEQ